MEGSSGKDAGCADEGGDEPRNLQRDKDASAEGLGVGRISPIFTGWGKKYKWIFVSGSSQQ